MTADESPVIDAEARQSALDISRSIAVQAPAGSGKTELLSLRFLKLLAVCQHPEEVLAITFTKKAANEMSERILSTLAWAESVSSDELDSPLDRDRYRIARSVLAQDAKEAWRLQQSPNRLRIQTIDSFSNFLASRLPILSNFGGPIAISEEVDDCYRLAVRNLFKLLDSELPIAPAIAELMLHLDNETEKLETLLTSLLRQREQWIGDVVGVASSPQQAFDYLQDNLLELVTESIADVASLLSPFEPELLPLLDFATQNLAEAGSDSTLLLCAGLVSLPGTEPAHLSEWIALTELLLTKSRDKVAFRKTVDKKCGFPAPSSSKEQKQLLTDRKQAMQALLVSMAESSELLQALDYLRRLPMPDDDPDSWAFLDTLTAILPTLMAQLEIAFAQRKKVDYPQVSLAALRALGNEDKPTDLTLSLDYQIQHILVDEFQDTSSSQMDLLARLTAGWEVADGRTLFVVGDAMQSCYGFRNANVGLFIKLRQTGLGQIPMSSIDLQANFRSDSGVVDWVNAIFSQAFPQEDDISRGAVRYSESHAVHPVDISPAVSSRLYQYGEDSKLEAQIEEASFIAEEISRLRKQYPERTVAILVRSRPLLKYILPALREAEIPWLATEIDSLNALPIITDLISLTSAICNETDRLSWLAILRAPWCGLSLQDLHTVANFGGNISVMQSLRELCVVGEASPLTDDGHARALRLTHILDWALAAKLQGRISHVVRGAFVRLGGRQIIASAAEGDSVERFFEILLQSEVAGGLENISEFEARVAKSYVSAPTQTENNPVQIMTIHKSKGLEFDHVFLPGLASPGRSDDKSLLLWHQRLNEAGRNKLFLATLSATGSEDNSLYNLLRYEKAEKSRLERARLLYIGITRAMKSVYLSAVLADKEGEPAPPASRSLLATIWDSLQQSERYTDTMEFISVQSLSLGIAPQDPLTLPPSLYRLCADSITPAPSVEGDSEPAEEEETEKELSSGIDNQLHSEVGTLVHEALQNFVDYNQSMEDVVNPELRDYWTSRLRPFGFDAAEIAQALSRIEHSLRSTLGSTELGWLFDSTLKQSATELALQSHGNGFVHTHVIDRTFIDDSGVRWIIDYKSSTPVAGQTTEDFVNEQITLYSGQLARYRSLFEGEENLGIKTALLLTSLPQLVECG